MEYWVTLEREGDVFIVDVPDLPGCITEVHPQDDFDAVVVEAVEGWLESALADGESPPRPTERPSDDENECCTVRVGPRLAARLQLRWAREEAELTQAELAHRVGVSQQAIAALESPDANFRLSTLEKVARALDLDLDLTLTPHRRNNPLVQLARTGKRGRFARA